MKEKTELKVMFYFTVAYMLFFTLVAVLRHNYEFMYYAAAMTILILIIVFYHKKMHLSRLVIGSLTFTGLIHLLGGNIYIGTVRLYDYWLISGILRYDNLVHFWAIFVATLVAYNLLHPHLDKKMDHNKFLLSLMLILIASGIGALNEVFELGAVVFLDAGRMVGDYMNNALDLLFNLAGSILACVAIVEYHYKKK